MDFKSEFLAFAFGALLVFLTFGDDYLSRNIGNLDTIFGIGLWPVVDIVLPVATVAVFLLYGWERSKKLRINPMSVLLFLSFLAVLILISVDDFAHGLHIPFSVPPAYWTVVMWVFPVYSAIAFFLFRKINQTKIPTQKE